MTFRWDFQKSFPSTQCRGDWISCGKTITRLSLKSDYHKYVVARVRKYQNHWAFLASSFLESLQCRQLTTRQNLPTSFLLVTYEVTVNEMMTFSSKQVFPQQSTKLCTPPHVDYFELRGHPATANIITHPATCQSFFTTVFSIRFKSLPVTQVDHPRHFRW